MAEKFKGPAPEGQPLSVVEYELNRAELAMLAAIENSRVDPGAIQASSITRATLRILPAYEWAFDQVLAQAGIEVYMMRKG